MDIPLAVLIAVVTFSIAVLAVVVLPFLAALLHITYAVDNASLTALIGALGGVVGAIIMNWKSIKDSDDKS